MRRETKHLSLVITLVILDVLAIAGSFLAAYYLRFAGKIVPVFHDVPPLPEYLKLLVIGLLTWLYIFRVSGFYSVERFHPGFIGIAKAVTMGMLLVMTLTFFYRGFSYSRIVVIFAWIINVAVLYLCRYFVQQVMNFRHRQGRDLVRILIIGAGRTGQLVTEKISMSSSRIGYSIAGYLDDALPSGGEIRGIRVLGATDKLKEIISRENIDEVIIALPGKAKEKISGLTFACEEMFVKCQVVPDLFELVTASVDVETLEGIPLVSLKQVLLAGWNLVIKRIIDISGSLAGIILLSPVLVICALIVKFSSQGPVLFKQERVGRDGRKFTIYKFRSMKTSAEDKTGPVWAKSGDPRRTRAGVFLRRLSLDELPQLFNVLKGDMSLVGPRPEREYFVEQFNRTIERYFIRHKVKSGITGWAQVNGLRGDTSIEERTKYDLYYVESWTVWFDLKILLMTVTHVIIGTHAY